MSLKFLVGVIAGLLLGANIATAQVLDNVEVTRAGAHAIINARFSTPIQYVRHFPVKSGDTLQISLRVIPIGPGSTGSDSANERRTFRPTKLDGLPLRDVTYEGDAADGPRLVVRFDRKTDYNVRTGSDQRSIVIDVPLTAEMRDKNASSIFVINLATLDKPITRAPSLPGDLPSNRVYLIPYSDERGTRYRLRLGFFNTPEEATAVKNKLKTQFPGASISLTNASERDESGKFTLPPATAGTVSTPLPTAAPTELPKPPVPAPSLPPPNAALSVPNVPSKSTKKPAPKIQTASDKSAEKLFKSGRDALLQGNNPKAIDLFTEVLALPANTYSADAQELLGLALERNKQIDLAKVEYRLYLKQYPDTEGAERVQQRLAVLEPGSATKLTEAKNKVLPSDYQTYGTIAQNYYHGATKVDSTTTVGGLNPTQQTFTTTDQSLLITHANLVTRLRDEHYDNRAVFNGDVYTDFLNHDKSGNRVSSAYLELADRGHTALARLGRQTGNSLGVLGRFDGALLGGNFLPLWRADVVVGKPVDQLAPDSRRLFVGTGIGVGPIAERWNGNVYAIQQNVDSFVDRRAVGSELRYFDPTHTAFALLDYDVYFNTLNIAMLQGNWLPTPATNFNWLIDRRKTPTLLLSDALIGQPASSINDLSAVMSEQQMKDAARGNTADATTGAIGVTHTLTSRVQLGGNLIYNKTGDSALQASTGNIFIYDTQLIVNNLIFKDDVDVLSANFTDARDYQGKGLALISRFPIRNRWRVELGYRLYQQDNINGTKVDRMTPSFKLDYRTARGLTIESEWGYERAHTTGADINETTGSTFFMVGWRVDF